MIYIIFETELRNPPNTQTNPSQEAAAVTAACPQEKDCQHLLVSS